MPLQRETAGCFRSRVAAERGETRQPSGLAAGQNRTRLGNTNCRAGEAGANCLPERDGSAGWCTGAQTCEEGRIRLRLLRLLPSPHRGDSRIRDVQERQHPASRKRWSRCRRLRAASDYLGAGRATGVSAPDTRLTQGLRGRPHLAEVPRPRQLGGPVALPVHGPTRKR